MMVDKNFPVLGYDEILKYLYTRLPMFQRTGPAAYKNNLDNTMALAALYGEPHKKFRSVHVAGTNGKGSVSHMLAAVFQTAGYKTGLYTSPHLKDFRERIRINGEMIPKNFVAEWVSRFQVNNTQWKIEPSFFELTMTMAFDYFASEKADIAIVEVGLGGRLDSTNVITPELSVITNIGMDHMALLGDTLEKIGAEKAGIIKHEVPVVVGTTQSETSGLFAGIASEKGAPCYFADQVYSVPYSMKDLEGRQVMAVVRNGETVYPGLRLGLLGMYQRKNLPAVLMSVEVLRGQGWKIKDQDLFDALSEVTTLTGLMGRWQVLGYDPLVVCDTGHNADGIRELVQQIRETPHNRLLMVFGMVSDKDPEGILRLLPAEARYYFTQAGIPRAMDAGELALRARDLGLQGEPYSSVKEAFNEARRMAGRNDMIFVGGSTFVVAEIL